ncbi:desiccation-related protein PCC13-62 [Morus notabilis]|uniref:desiccation-related protein PCC13-62 n=1 Tax=Morus notabilis TaxID=981085 RepID=UPI000CED30CD|nr:desiccation-related protein PCC13-62 [Morus notabilis]
MVARWVTGLELRISLNMLEFVVGFLLGCELLDLVIHEQWPNIIASSYLHAFLFVLSFELILVWGSAPDKCSPIVASDSDLIEFALNLEFFEAEFLLHGALGKGLDSLNSSLAQGGPPPIGARKANLDPLVHRIIEEFGYQEFGKIACRAIVSRTRGIPRPLLNLSSESFARISDQAVGFNLRPSFGPYANTLNYLLAAYTIPYVGLSGYVGTIPRLFLPSSRSLVASLLGVESGRDAVTCGARILI